MVIAAAMMVVQTLCLYVKWFAEEWKEYGG